MMQTRVVHEGVLTNDFDEGEVPDTARCCAAC